MGMTTVQFSISSKLQEISVTYKPSKKSDINGSFLREYVDGIRMNQVLGAFPGGKVSGVCDPEKGYDEPDCVFCDPSTGGVFNVYSRFGSVRIGAPYNVTDEAVQKFKTWLLAQV